MATPGGTVPLRLDLFGTAAGWTAHFGEMTVDVPVHADPGQVKVGPLEPAIATALREAANILDPKDTTPMANPEDLAHRFAHHPPRDQATITAHETIRAAAHEFARVVNDLAPESGEKVLALTRVEEAMMWANAAIARHPEDSE